MKKCFVIMPFGNPFDEYYQIIKSALDEIQFYTLRGDEVYTNRPIIEDIIEQICAAEIIIADVSFRNPNVNYELGFAHALRKEVIIISQDIDDIPFDYRHIRSILYNTKESGWKRKLNQNLQRTIATIQNDEFEKSTIIALEKFYNNISSKDLLGLERIFKTRQSMNVFIDKIWEKNISNLDIIAFGLKSFRNFRTAAVLEQIRSGLKIRILTLAPNSRFVKQRENDEDLINKSISKSIVDLIDWSNKINLKTATDGVKIKYYNALPLDFYWRQDDNIFIGPYLFGIDSQQTITYHFRGKSYIGEFYSKYFEGLWNDDSFSTTELSRIRP